MSDKVKLAIIYSLLLQACADLQALGRPEWADRYLHKAQDIA